jgi:hypothetical protein
MILIEEYLEENLPVKRENDKECKAWRDGNTLAFHDIAIWQDKMERLVFYLVLNSEKTR